MFFNRLYTLKIFVLSAFVLALVSCTTEEESSNHTVAQTANNQCVAYTTNSNGKPGFPVYCNGKYIGALADGTNVKTSGNGSSSTNGAGAGSSNYDFKVLPGGGLVIMVNGVALDTITDGKDGADGAQGEKGETGEKGLDGSSCVAEEVLAGIRVICDGEIIGLVKHGEKGETGEAGTSCTAVANLNGIDIYCAGVQVGTLVNGENGESCHTEAVSKTEHSEYFGMFDYIVLCGEKFNGGLTNGKDGASCLVERSASGAVITCGTETVEIANGKNGDPCIVAETAGGLNITCNGETKFLANGQNGLNGKDGNSCTVKESVIAGVNGQLIECGATSAFVKDGLDGAQGPDGTVCVVTNKLNTEGTLVIGAKITCTDPETGNVTSQAEVLNGKDGAQGEKGDAGVAGVQGPKGESCEASPAVENGVQIGVNITCGSNAPVFLPKGEKGETGEKGDTGEAGKDGENGAAGTPGLSCSIGELVQNGNDTGYFITCGNQAPVFVRNGRDGASCIVMPWVDNQGVVLGAKLTCGSDTVEISNGKNGTDGVNGTSCLGAQDPSTKAITITCGNSVVGVLEKGEKGDTGEAGQDGQSCTVEGTSTTVHESLFNAGYAYAVVCGNAVVGKLRNGSSCSISDKFQGAATITCEDGTEATVFDGTNGADGIDCKADPVYESGKQVGVNIKCGDGQAVFLPNGQDGANGADGNNGTDGSSCSVDTNEKTERVGTEDFTGYWITCGSDRVFVRNGRDGASCAIAPWIEGSELKGASITCGTYPAVKISNGAKGETGDAGEAGASCEGVQNPNTQAITISCGGQVVGVLEKGAKGDKGETGDTGAAGKDGESCTVEQTSQTAHLEYLNQGYQYVIVCGSLKKVAGALRNGSSCTVSAKVDGKATLSCSDGTSVEIQDGVAGATGNAGTSCTAERITGGVNIICGNTTQFLADGADGSAGAAGLKGDDGTSCSIATDETTIGNNTGYLLTCGSTSVLIKNGKNGSDGQNATCVVTDKIENGQKVGVTISCTDVNGTTTADVLNGAEGAKGPAGESCVARAVNDGVEITCGNNTPLLLKHGEEGAMGSAGTSCSVGTEIELNGRKGYMITCTDGTEAFVKNGLDGESCSVMPKTDGMGNVLGVTVTCGQLSQDVLNGTSGKDGSSCSGEQNSDGSISITCGGNLVGVLEKGAQGEKGDAGADGASCAVEEVSNATYPTYFTEGYAYVIVCGTNKVVSGALRNGRSCTVSKTGSTATISCSDGTSVEINDGAQGVQGVPGNDGKSCRAVAVNNGVNIICGNDDAIFVRDGKDGKNGLDGNPGQNGESCSVGSLTTENNVTGYWLTCPNDSVFVRNGQDGTSCTIGTKNAQGEATITCGTNAVVIRDGAAGAAGTNGSSCTSVAFNENGESGIEISCPDQTNPIRILNGKDGANGSNGNDGTSCSIEEKQDGTGAVVTCGANSVFIRNGIDGVGCTASDKDNNGNVIITCGSENKQITISDGVKGAKGDDGESCTSEAIANGVIITCPGASPITLVNGEKGEKGDTGAEGLAGKNGTSCIVERTTQNGAEGALIKCGDTDPGVFIRDGRNAECTVEKAGNVATITCINSNGNTTTAQITDGLDGAQGTSCYAEEVLENNELTGAQILCGTNAPIFIPKGEKGETGAQGPQGTQGIQGPKGESCSVGEEETYENRTGYWLTCTDSTRAFVKNGKDGTSCEVSAKNAQGEVTITCGTNAVVIRDGAAGAAGKNGENCTSEAIEINGVQGVRITCPEQNPIDILNGTNGTNGTNGENGASCRVEDKLVDNVKIGATIICGIGSNITTAEIRNGTNGESCSVTRDNINNRVTLTCANHDPVYIYDGAVGATGANGESCEAEAVANGIKISCPGVEPVTLLNGKDGAQGEPGETGAVGPAGESCIVDPTETSHNGRTGYWLTCGTNRVFVKNGINCIVSAKINGTVTITCGEDQVEINDGARGEDGSSCHAEKDANGNVNILCGNNDPVIIKREDLMGEKGESCSVVDTTLYGANGVLIQCGANDPGSFIKGNDYKRCTITYATANSKMATVACEGANPIIFTDNVSGAVNDLGNICSTITNEDGLKILCENGRTISIRPKIDDIYLKIGSDSTECTSAKTTKNSIDGTEFSCPNKNSIFVKNGAKGKDCSVEQSGDNMQLTCDGIRYSLLNGAAGATSNSANCSTESTSDGLKISCGSDVFTLNHTRDNLDANGNSCLVQAGTQGEFSGHIIACGATETFIKNGTGGKLCSITQSGVNATLTCEGKSFALTDHLAGATKGNSSCTTNAIEKGIVITCGSETVTLNTKIDAFKKGNEICTAQAKIEDNIAGVNFNCGNIETFIKNGSDGKTFTASHDGNAITIALAGVGDVILTNNKAGAETATTLCSTASSEKGIAITCAGKDEVVIDNFSDALRVSNHVCTINESGNSVIFRCGSNVISVPNGPAIATLNCEVDKDRVLPGSQVNFTVSSAKVNCSGAFNSGEEISCTNLNSNYSGTKTLTVSNTPGVFNYVYTPTNQTNFNGGCEKRISIYQETLSCAVSKTNINPGDAVTFTVEGGAADCDGTVNGTNLSCTHDASGFSGSLTFKPEIPGEVQYEYLATNANLFVAANCNKKVTVNQATLGARAAGSQEIDIGETFTLQLTSTIQCVSKYCDGTITVNGENAENVIWDHSNEYTKSFTPKAPGTYVITFTPSNKNFFDKDSVSYTLIVGRANLTCAVSATTVNPGETFSFSVAGETADCSGTVASQNIACTKGSDNLYSGVKNLIAPDEPGTYPYVFNATNDFYENNSCTKEVRVRESTLSITGKASANYSEEYTLTLSSSIACLSKYCSGTVTGTDGTEIAVEWNSGTTKEVVFTPKTSGAITYTFTPTNSTFFNVESITHAVTLARANLTAPTNTTINLGETFSFALSSSLNCASAYCNGKITINDASPESITWNSGKSYKKDFKPTTPGVYTLKFTPTNTNFFNPNGISTTVTVNAATLSCSVDRDTINAGETFTFTVNGGAGDCDGFLDEGTTTLNCEAGANGFTGSKSYTLTTPGTHTYRFGAKNSNLFTQSACTKQIFVKQSTLSISAAQTLELGDSYTVVLNSSIPCSSTYCNGKISDGKTETSVVWDNSSSISKTFTPTTTGQITYTFTPNNKNFFNKNSIAVTITVNKRNVTVSTANDSDKGTFSKSSAYGWQSGEITYSGLKLSNLPPDNSQISYALKNGTDSIAGGTCTKSGGCSSVTFTHPMREVSQAQTTTYTLYVNGVNTNKTFPFTINPNTLTCKVDNSTAAKTINYSQSVTYTVTSKKSGNISIDGTNVTPTSSSGTYTATLTYAPTATKTVSISHGGVSTTCPKVTVNTNTLSVTKAADIELGNTITFTLKSSLACSGLNCNGNYTINNGTAQSLSWTSGTSNAITYTPTTTGTVIFKFTPSTTAFFTQTSISDTVIVNKRNVTVSTSNDSDKGKFSKSSAYGWQSGEITYSGLKLSNLPPDNSKISYALKNGNDSIAGGTCTLNEGCTSTTFTHPMSEVSRAQTTVYKLYVNGVNTNKIFPFTINPNTLTCKVNNSTNPITLWAGESVTYTITSKKSGLISIDGTNVNSTNSNGTYTATRNYAPTATKTVSVSHGGITVQCPSVSLNNNSIQCGVSARSIYLGQSVTYTIKALKTFPASINGKDISWNASTSTGTVTLTPTAHLPEVSLSNAGGSDTCPSVTVNKNTLSCAIRHSSLQIGNSTTFTVTTTKKPTTAWSIKNCVTGNWSTSGNNHTLSYTCTPTEVGTANFGISGLSSTEYSTTSCSKSVDVSKVPATASMASACSWWDKNLINDNGVYTSVPREVNIAYNYTLPVMETGSSYNVAIRYTVGSSSTLNTAYEQTISNHKGTPITTGAFLVPTTLGDYSYHLYVDGVKQTACSLNLRVRPHNIKCEVRESGKTYGTSDISVDYGKKVYYKISGEIHSWIKKPFGPDSTFLPKDTIVNDVQQGCAIDDSEKCYKEFTVESVTNNITGNTFESYGTTVKCPNVTINNANLTCSVNSTSVTVGTKVTYTVKSNVAISSVNPSDKTTAKNIASGTTTFEYTPSAVEKITGRAITAPDGTSITCPDVTVNKPKITATNCSLSKTSISVGETPSIAFNYTLPSFATGATYTAVIKRQGDNDTLYNHKHSSGGSKAPRISYPSDAGSYNFDLYIDNVKQANCSPTLTINKHDISCSIAPTSIEYGSTTKFTVNTSKQFTAPTISGCKAGVWSGSGTNNTLTYTCTPTTLGTNTYAITGLSSSIYSKTNCSKEVTLTKKAVSIDDELTVWGINPAISFVNSENANQTFTIDYSVDFDFVPGATYNIKVKQGSTEKYNANISENNDYTTTPIGQHNVVGTYTYNIYLDDVKYPSDINQEVKSMGVASITAPSACYDSTQNRMELERNSRLVLTLKENLPQTSAPFTFKLKNNSTALITCTITNNNCSCNNNATCSKQSQKDILVNIPSNIKLADGNTASSNSVKGIVEVISCNTGDCSKEFTWEKYSPRLIQCRCEGDCSTLKYGTSRSAVYGDVTTCGNTTSGFEICANADLTQCKADQNTHSRECPIVEEKDALIYCHAIATAENGHHMGVIWSIPKIETIRENGVVRDDTLTAPIHVPNILIPPSAGYALVTKSIIAEASGKQCPNN